MAKLTKRELYDLIAVEVANADTPQDQIQRIEELGVEYEAVMSYSGSAVREGLQQWRRDIAEKNLEGNERAAALVEWITVLHSTAFELGMRAAFKIAEERDDGA